ncbi:lysozyme inhibitor LprI family protein [Butyrivibrio sp. FC2001]|uniref:lysozyme inhibitor LprI family protein n=1 Tax=Butyrivibrio sp. FC2001 TaxID=1280671 RepID=UPI000429ED2E|nr:lysozyme inhibitor LprI family protein [Butyrivibrio sp. FC2001]
MKKVNALLMSLGLCTLIAGCTPTVQNGSEDLFSNRKDTSAEGDNFADNIEQDTANSEEADWGADASQDESTGEASDAGKEEAQSSEAATGSEALQKVIEGEGKISFSYYKENILGKARETSYIEDFLTNIPADKEFTLSELRDELMALNDVDPSSLNDDNDVSLMEYAYLDCGADGVPELSLQIKKPFVEAESTGNFILKEIDGKVQVVYVFASWSRSDTSINEYGFISGSGSNSAANHGFEQAYIDADGKYNYGYYEEQELYFDGFAEFKEHDKFDTSGLEGDICVYTLRLQQYYDDYNGNEIYSYEVVDSETYQTIDVPNLYTDSEYKKIMDCFHDLKIVPLDELKKAEEEKLTSIGATDEIRAGKALEYTEIDPAIYGGDGNSADSASSENNDVIDYDTIKDDGTIQSELAMVEQSYQEYVNMDWSIMTQSEMSITAEEIFNLWDTELNSLWSRLTKTVSPEKKEELLADQRSWIKEKEAAIKKAGDAADGGSIRPMIENEVAYDYTRQRVYYLAGVLAKARGESFEIPAIVQESFD